MKKVKRTKILHIISGYGGGISSHIRNLAEAIDPDKILFDVVGFTDYTQDFIEAIYRTNGNVFTMPRPKIDGYVKFIRYVIKIIKNNGPYDIVQCHISGYRALIFRIICSYCGMKTMIVHAHSTSIDNSKIRSNIIRRLVDRRINLLAATNLVSCSTEAARFAFGDKAIKNNKVFYIPNSIAQEKYMIKLKCEEIYGLKRKINIPENILVVGHVGRFNYPKNHVFMIEIIKEMAKLEMDFVWLFIGTGELESIVKQRIHEEQLDLYVRFLGRREDVYVLYQTMDVLILPSFFEGLPTVVVEAQAEGIPSVISNSITKEVDMGLGMVKYMSLDENIDCWIDALIKVSKIVIPDTKERLEALSLKKFTNKTAASLYEDFVMRT